MEIDEDLKPKKPFFEPGRPENFLEVLENFTKTQTEISERQTKILEKQTETQEVLNIFTFALCLATSLYAFLYLINFLIQNPNIRSVINNSEDSLLCYALLVIILFIFVLLVLILIYSGYKLSKKLIDDLKNYKNRKDKEKLDPYSKFIK